MKITLQPLPIESLIVSPEQLAPRSPGTHVSGVINKIAVALGRRDNDFSLDDLNHFALLGRVFEVVLAQTLFKPPEYQRVGEIECDGVIGSPDAFNHIHGRVAEFKCTWKSSKRSIQEFREYLWQIMSYCYMTQVLEAELVILHICGNWTPPVPVLRHYLIKFTKPELIQNWQMIQRNR